MSGSGVFGIVLAIAFVLVAAYFVRRSRKSEHKTDIAGGGAGFDKSKKSDGRPL